VYERTSLAIRTIRAATRRGASGKGRSACRAETDPPRAA
jgi:hypothetical protein